MSELNFPKDPQVGQEYSFGSLLYVYDGVKWTTKGSGYNPVSELYEILSSDGGASFVGEASHPSVQAALDSLVQKDASLHNEINLLQSDKEVLECDEWLKL